MVRKSNRPVWTKNLFIPGGACKNRTSSPELLIVTKNSFENGINKKKAVTVNSGQTPVLFTIFFSICLTEALQRHQEISSMLQEC